jgi:hypothetical protein
VPFWLRAGYRINWARALSGAAPHRHRSAWQLWHSTLASSGNEDLAPFQGRKVLIHVDNARAAPLSVSSGQLGTSLAMFASGLCASQNGASSHRSKSRSSRSDAAILSNQSETSAIRCFRANARVGKSSLIRALAGDD